MRTFLPIVLATTLFNCYTLAAEATDPLRILRLSAAGVVAKMGKPDKLTDGGSNAYLYSYNGQELVVNVVQNQVVSYCAFGKSNLTTSNGVKVGATLEQVTAAFGSLTAKQESTSWSDTDQPGVLYRNSTSGQYKATYPEQNVSFIFDAEKKVMSFMVSDCLRRVD